VAVEPLRIPVHLFADNAEVRARPVWEKALRERVAAASDVLQRQAGVKLEVVAVGEWSSDPRAANYEALATDFEKTVTPEPRAKLAIGYTSRAVRGGDEQTVTLTGCTRGPLRTHLLIRERHPRTEGERIEVLVHELGHVLGAAHAPDLASAMRPKLGDGQAADARFRVGIDPLNLLAVGLWAEELRERKVKKWEDLKPLTQRRLRVVYRTIALLTPDDTVARGHLETLDRLLNPGGEVAVAPPDRNPEPAKPAVPGLSPQQEAARKVVRAVTLRAADLAKLAPADRPKGDKLTGELVRAAADAAVTLDEDAQVPGFLIGLGIALDDSTTLQGNPLTGKFCTAVETEADRRERLAALGVPTVRHRRDLCQHFCVSVALAELLGPAQAEVAGVTKELLDMRGESGFSFADLTADFAGVAFAKAVKADRDLIAKCRDGFKVEDYVPTVTDLREGLTAKQFAADYGGLDDPRFQKATADAHKRVAEMPGFKK
jgi:hypothetical protein